jgi:hypothetical protein
MLAPSDGTTMRRYLEWPQPDCLKNSQCKWRIVRLGLRLSVEVKEQGKTEETLSVPANNTKTVHVTDQLSPTNPTATLKNTEGSSVPIDPLHAARSFFGQTLGIILFAAYFPAFIAYFKSQVILESLVQMVFGDLDDHPQGYDNPIARAAGYAALSASVLIGAAVAILETVAVLAAIAGTPLYR